MKYITGIDGHAHEIELLEREGRTVAVLEGRGEVSVDLCRIGSGESYSLLLGGKSHRFSVRADGGVVHVRLDGAAYRVTVETERERLLRRTRPTRGAGDAGRGGRKVVSEMAGIVVRTLVEEGARVAAGDPLLILEAMKMENEVRAPVPGAVKGIHVEEGATVLVGDLLVTLEG